MSDAPSPRNVLAELLAPVTAGMKTIRSYAGLERLEQPVMIIKQNRIEPHPALPTNSHLIGFVVTIASPYADVDRAEDQLDGLVNDLIHAIDDTDSIMWTSADRTQVQDQFHAYDINVQLISKKE